MKIAIGADHLGIALMAEIVSLLAEKRIEVTDYGITSGVEEDYPDIGERVALAVQSGHADRGILICGTGIGMAIVANKVPGVRAAVVHDPYSAERSRKSNNAQILAMGSLIIGPQLARTLVSIWLDSEFQGGNSARKIKKIDRMETLGRKNPAQRSS